MIIQSYWIRSTPKSSYSKLDRNIETDIAIVGGGITGITTAYLLENLGYKVVLLESKRIVEGATGNTTAKITSQHELIYSYLITQFGIDTAKVYGQIQEEAIDLIEEIIKKERISADFKRTNNFVYTQNNETLEDFNKEVKAARSIGLPADLVGSSDLPFKISGAISFRNQAQFHPRKYLLALAKKINKSSSLIFENTRAIKINEGDPCEIKTQDGFSILSKKVIVATHFPILNEGLYFARLIPIRSYALGLTLNSKLEGMFISFDGDFFSIRNQPNGNEKIFIVGGLGHRTGQESDTINFYEQLKNKASEKLPVKKISYHWATQDNQTLDRIPYVGKYTPNSTNLFVACGYGGWGMTNGTAAAMILRDIITNKFNPAKKVFDPNRFSQVNLKSTKNLLKDNVEVAKHFFRDRLRTAFHKYGLTDLQKGDGKILEIEGKKAAVYKDEHGDIFIVNPHCSHMGCILNFNNSEKSWDCPCHGSRFNYKGEVLQSPAIKDLSSSSGVVLEDFKR